jgi:hypothetical protein
VNFDIELSVRSALRCYAKTRGTFNMIFLAMNKSPWPELVPTEIWKSWVLEEKDRFNQLTLEKINERKNNPQWLTEREHNPARATGILYGQNRSRRARLAKRPAEPVEEPALDAPLSGHDVAIEQRSSDPHGAALRSETPPGRTSER